jgi:hypothetical protein
MFHFDELSTSDRLNTSRDQAGCAYGPACLVSIRFGTKSVCLCYSTSARSGVW